MVGLQVGHLFLFLFSRLSEYMAPEKGPVGGNQGVAEAQHQANTCLYSGRAGISHGAALLRTASDSELQARPTPCPGMNLGSKSTEVV